MLPSAGRFRPMGQINVRLIFTVFREFLSLNSKFQHGRTYLVIVKTVAGWFCA